MYRKRVITVALLALGIALLSSLLLLTPSYYLARVSENILSARQVEQKNHEVGTLQKSESDAVAEINNRLKVFAEKAPESPLVSIFLDGVLKQKTSNIHITDMTFTRANMKTNEASVEIKGTAIDRTALLDFGDRLRSAKGFSSVVLPISNFIKDSEVPFTITATLALK